MEYIRRHGLLDLELLDVTLTPSFREPTIRERRQAVRTAFEETLIPMVTTVIIGVITNAI